MPEGELAKPSVSDAYKQILLKLWIDISSNSISFMDNFLSSNLDPQQRRDLIINLREAWIQIYPKVKGWKDREEENLKELSVRIEDYKQYFYNPALLLDEDAGVDILEFQLLIRECLEALGVTTFEEVK